MKALSVLRFSFFCVSICKGVNMKIIKKLLMVVFLFALQGCQENDSVQFEDGLELCNENGIIIKLDEIINNEKEKQVVLNLEVENDNLKEAYISFDEIRVNGLITEEINESQYIYLESGYKEKKIVTVDYSDIATLGIHGINDIASIDMKISSDMAESPNINYLEKNISIYPFGTEKKLNMQDLLESYRIYENENLEIYYIGNEDENLVLYIKNKMREEIAIDFMVKNYDDSLEIDLSTISDSSVTRYTFVAGNNEILVKIPSYIVGNIECSFDVYYSEYFRQEEPLMKDSFNIEIGND